jgi:hypothetical protein
VLIHIILVHFLIFEIYLANERRPRNISGTLPLDVSFLSRLTFFALTKESLSGSFPDWSRMTGLTSVLVNYNKLTGSFPTFLLAKNSMLEILHLRGNSFRGLLPSFPESTFLTDLRLNYNEFSGSIIPAISNLQALSTFQ